MRGRILLIAACLLASACSRDWDGRDARAPGFPASAQTSPGDTIPPSIAPQSIASRANRGFAALPDRGDLTAYRKNVVRRDGAYTWHRADISEQHALRAIVDGTLTVTAPSGDVLRFAYDRHVEHPSGDWTWFGRLEQGDASEQAIITFGERAVFGSIGQPAEEPLKLTVRDGVAWLVETNRAAVGRIVNAATRPRGPDYLVPPDLGPRKASGDGRTMAAAPVMGSAEPPAGTTVVDLVLGYTSGFAANLGGASAAVTRLNFLVDVVNQSYVNSQIAAQVRLVHTLQVSYPDATANNTTLEELTGYRSGTGFITPNPAFDALRAARDQYGADLVSLVRKFNDPENDGCGIAWLIGAAQSGIDANDEPFGYSVVSDGTDLGSDGKTYFCRDETLAHEMGHNMGSQHDRETAKGTDGTLDAKDYGVFPYSFGHKTTSGGGNFFTIMAYGDSGQTRYRVFSNPRITFCGGFACGINNQADNARSLTTTAPIVAAFRATVVAPALARPKADFDGDGRSDIYWRNIATGDNGLWRMDGASVAGAWLPHREPDQNWTVVGTGDFNADNRSDVLWRHALTGQVYIQFMDGPNILPSSGFSTTVGDMNWTIVALADFDADSRTDLYWRNVSTGLTYLWLMDGVTPRSMLPVHHESDQNWKVAGAADHNGDGYADILWRNGSSGQNYIHFMNGASILPTSGSLPTVVETAWKVVAVGDFTGDGRGDIYWRNSSTGVTYLWTLNGLTVVAIEYVHTAGLPWEVVGSGDYNGDGRADIFWRNSATGDNHVHLMSGAMILPGSAAPFPVSDLNWKVVSR